MNELEVKFWCDDVAYVDAQLVRLGFTEKKKLHQKDSYMLTGERKDPSGKGIFLRIREDGNGTSFDHHIRMSPIEIAEIEVNVDDPEKIKQIMTSLGLPVKHVVDKKRRVFKKDAINVVIDEVADLGTFVEIETFGTTTDAVEQTLLSLAKELGLAREIRNNSYVEMLKKLKKHPK